MAVPLAGLRVIDASTLFAGPLAAALLADYGADVVKVEQPEGGDPARTHGYAKDGVGLWWKTIGRNKRSVTANLRHPDGQELFRRLAAGADVVIENFRPGTLERWNLGYDRLAAENPGLVLARVTGYGQFGPAAGRAGFGTLAEAMSGFAHVTGSPDGPPTLPPFGLADGIAGTMCAFAILTALRARDASGRGQVIDISLIEPILSLLGPQATVYDQLGIVQQRTGNRSINNAPRNTYLTADERWVAVSTSATTVAERVLRLVGREDVTREPWFGAGRERATHADELDDIVAGWIATRSFDEVMAKFEEAGAAIAPVYDVEQILADPQYAALRSIVDVNDPELGTMKMTNVAFRLSETPGEIRWTGPRLGEHNPEVYGALGVDPGRLEELRREGVV
jgi:crotonobetainyl-CoA:carnitine CoA-transferase CaiB-like acyl-CoA transferase